MPILARTAAQEAAETAERRNAAVPTWTQESAAYTGPTTHAPPTALTGAELLALQLAARGYALEQIARLTEAHDAGGVVALLRRAAEALGAADAVGEARRRGLIVSAASGPRRVRE